MKMKYLILLRIGGIKLLEYIVILIIVTNFNDNENWKIVMSLILFSIGMSTVELAKHKLFNKIK